MLIKTKALLFAASISVSLWGCKADGEFAGTEFAPQMYTAVSYEPLSQVIDSTAYDYNSSRYNNYGGKKFMNMREPVEGTVKRQNYTRATGSVFASDTAKLLMYDLHKDSIALASRILKNPIPLDSAGQVLAEGKHLYTNFCSPCHGEGGKGDGKVGEMYKGVANLVGGAVKNATEGHIFHTITHGRNRMWAHKSQINPEERWKIVHYVQQLQREN
jgi:mono/diheme cytochrome c family protein